ncbi:laccase-12-like protein [Cinnamomum micranthum f. kanehirae]|uniref:Laccase-12-like protein n=1 Tax=Cinnamomum micranthum f. kanehirae TaxID=337451 RepID=A0A3S3NK09_9MAGN|nr:laccase-12-like protein [Cinnamomum micranthum f. kanehirae]
MEANYTVRPWCSYFLPGLCLLFAITVSMAHAEVQYRDFIVQERPVKRLCKTHNIITVNGQFPGPTLEVRNGDTLVINVVNRAQYNVTLHWHGIRQLRTAWADGPSYITQCPIRPGGRYTYRFTIEDQEGTLWWHAHSSWLRATVYGALIIHPKLNTPYPFPKYNQEVPIILGNKSSNSFQEKKGEGVFIGKIPFRLYKDKKDLQNSMLTNDVREMNGDIHAHAETVIIPVDSGETYLLRIINAAMNQEALLQHCRHQMTVVSADAVYTKAIHHISPSDNTRPDHRCPPHRQSAARPLLHGSQGLRQCSRRRLRQHHHHRHPPIQVCLAIKIKTICSHAFLASTTPVWPLPLQINSRARLKSQSRPTSMLNLFFTIGLGLFNCPRGP